MEKHNKHHTHHHEMIDEHDNHEHHHETMTNHNGHNHQNHQNHHDGHDHSEMVEDFKKRFFVSLALTIPILLLSPMIQMFMGFNWGFPGMPICYLFYPQCFLFMEEALYYWS